MFFHWFLIYNWTNLSRNINEFSKLRRLLRSVVTSADDTACAWLFAFKYLALLTSCYKRLQFLRFPLIETSFSSIRVRLHRSVDRESTRRELKEWRPLSSQPVHLLNLQDPNNVYVNILCNFVDNKIQLTKSLKSRGWDCIYQKVTMIMHAHFLCVYT
jgi:hypothetical protein